MMRLASPLVALALVAPSGVSAQDPPPTFGADAQVVVLDLVARDKKGKPVEDLDTKEITVFEDGRACEVLSFRLVRSMTKPQGAATESGAARVEVAAGPVATPAATPTRPGLVVLVFDRLPPESAILARRGALELMKRSFPPDTWFAVFKTGYGVTLLEPFTTDAGLLQNAIERATSGDRDVHAGPLAPGLPPRKREAGADRTPEEMVPDLREVASSLGRAEESEARRVQGLDSLFTVLGVTQALERVEGRKAIVYFADGWALRAGIRTLYDTLISTANRSNVVIHTVNARGLRAQRVSPLAGGTSTPLDVFDSVIDRFSAEHRGGPGAASTTAKDAAGGGASGDGMKDGGSAMHAYAQGSEEIEARTSGPRMENLAEDTGGLAIANTNDLGASLSQVAEELGLYYEVVYAPANPALDGRFRNIEAKVSRSGVRVRTRKGYFATSRKQATVAAYELPLLDALAAPEPKGDFTLRARILHFGTNGSERECLFLAEVPLSEIQLDRDPVNGTYRGNLSLVGFVKDEEGRVVARLTQDRPLSGPLANRERARSEKAVFESALTLAGGRYTLEVAVHDRPKGAFAVVRNAFTVEPVGPELSLGSVVVVEQAGSAPKETPARDPLRVGEVLLMPSLGTRFEEGSRPEIPVSLTLWPKRDGGSAELTVELRQGDTIVASAKPSLPAADQDGRVSWLGSIPAARLTVGQYEIVVTARQGETLAEERAPIEITPSAKPKPIRASLDPALESLLERAGRYVVEYEQSFKSIVAEEVYTQRVSGTKQFPKALPSPPVQFEDGSLQVRTRADVVFVRLAGEIPWGVLRDVFEANGVLVRDRDERLQKLFLEPVASVRDQALRIVQESARFNMGPSRTLNIPTLALLFLHPQNQSRFSFKMSGRRKFHGFDGVEVEFEETARPGIVRDGAGGSVPASGRFWIEANRGAVLRSEVRYAFEPNRGAGFVATEYRAEPSLGIFVPDEMKERYADSPGTRDPVFGGTADASARYTNLRRFGVSVESETAEISTKAP